MLPRPSAQQAIRHKRLPLTPAPVRRASCAAPARNPEKRAPRRALPNIVHDSKIPSTVTEQAGISQAAPASHSEALPLGEPSPSFHTDSRRQYRCRSIPKERPSPAARPLYRHRNSRKRVYQVLRRQTYLLPFSTVDAVVSAGTGTHRA